MVTLRLCKQASSPRFRPWPQWHSGTAAEPERHRQELTAGIAGATVTGFRWPRRRDVEVSGWLGASRSGGCGAHPEGA